MFAPILLAASIASPGTLVILGGGKEAESAIQEVIRAAGGPTAKIVILAQSREEPSESARKLTEYFQSLGAKNVVAPAGTTPGQILEALRDARGVYMSGGNQNLFMQRLPESTGVPAAIRKVYETGGVVSGTSAGASLIGEWMPTGEDVEGAPIEPNAKAIAPGLGVWKGHLCDQHFLKRGRLARLLTLIETQPKLTGYGIEERAYLVVRPNKSMETFLGQTIRVERKNNGSFDVRVIKPKA